MTEGDLNRRVIEGNFCGHPFVQELLKHVKVRLFLTLTWNGGGLELNLEDGLTLWCREEGHGWRLFLHYYDQHLGESYDDLNQVKRRLYHVKDHMQAVAEGKKHREYDNLKVLGEAPLRTLEYELEQCLKWMVKLGNLTEFKMNYLG